MILSDEHLSKIAKSKTINLPIRLAQDPKLKKIVLQYRKMWESLPENVKTNPKFLKDIHSVSDGHFRGAMAEVISAWILNKYFQNITYDVSICGQTPDFYCASDNHSYIFETTCLGPGEEERAQTRNLNSLYKELNQHNSNIQLYIHGSPQPNEKGNFLGCLDKLKEQLSIIDPNSDQPFQFQHNGVSFNYSIFKTEEVGPLMRGWTGDATENPNKDLLLGKIFTKKDKYKFPFVLIGVTDTVFNADIHNTRSALVGDLQICIDKKTLKATEQRYTNTGFWGLQNSNLSNNLTLQGVLIIRTRINTTDEEDYYMELEIGLAENIHLKNGLSIVFNDIPDIFSDNNFLQITPPWV